MKKAIIFVVIIFCITLVCAPYGRAAGPKPGDIYKEYTVVPPGKKLGWVVFDVNATNKGAHKYLPNKTYHINIEDLDGAIRAEVLIDRWGGHAGTADKRIKFNGNKWIRLPELTTTPVGHIPSVYPSQDNPIVQVPLEYLKTGDNTLDGFSGPQVKYSFGWGQWGLYSAILRVYYDSSKPHPTGQVTSPASGTILSENPTISAQAQSDVGIEQIDFLGFYDGYDENGDGYYKDWHRFYHRKAGKSPEIPISGHVGTAPGEPWQVTWDTKWVPDQKKGKLKILARIKDKNGMWFVTEPVENLGLERKDYSVKLYKAHDVPEFFQVRKQRIRSCTITIPETDDLSRAKEAVLHFRTWNGDDNNPEIDGREWFWFNDHIGKVGGKNHEYAYTLCDIPLRPIKNGDNNVTVYSEAGTVYSKEGKLHNTHSLEVLWPGPGLTIRYEK